MPLFYLITTLCSLYISKEQLEIARRREEELKLNNRNGNNKWDI